TLDTANSSARSLQLTAYMAPHCSKRNSNSGRPWLILCIEAAAWRLRVTRAGCKSVTSINPLLYNQHLHDNGNNPAKMMHAEDHNDHHHGGHDHPATVFNVQVEKVDRQLNQPGQDILYQISAV
ncbi:hypothetical protein HK102_011515, partial [Quaeritorhiza haematococci]